MTRPSLREVALMVAEGAISVVAIPIAAVLWVHWRTLGELDIAISNARAKRIGSRFPAVLMAMSNHWCRVTVEELLPNLPRLNAAVVAETLEAMYQAGLVLKYTTDPVPAYLLSNRGRDALKGNPK